MPVFNYPAQNILLPSHRMSLHIAEIISLSGAIYALLAAFVIFCGWLFQVNAVVTVFGKSIINFPTALALVISSIAVFLYKRNKVFQTHGIHRYFIFMPSGLLLLAIGIITLFDNFFKNLGILHLISAVNLISGIIFSLIGASFIISFSKIYHRFHYAQFMIFIAIVLSLFEFLEKLYQYTASGKLSIDGQNSFLGSFLFFILCQSIIFTKPDRGFVELFTTDSMSSRLARLYLIYTIILLPFLGFFILRGEATGWFYAYAGISLFVILLIILSVFITWISVKLLYRSEVEHYLMKEALRVNNITLELNANDLSTKVTKLEQAKQEIADKLNYQQKLTDLVDKSN